jgi:hypothetical protein
VAELIFDYLIDVPDEYLINGDIPNHKNERVNKYLKILNMLFSLSRKDKKVIIINRATVQELDKKTFTICMCFDGGVSLDVLCDIVNEENCYRTPTKSPVKITVIQAFSDKINNINYQK